GKELQPETQWYDYGARMYDAALGRFFVQDRFAEKYLGHTPYHYTLNNPVNYIDINGDSVAILISPKGADGAGHMGMLIQNEDGKWSFWSKNGTDENAGLKGENSGDQAGEGEFESPDDFMSSDLNPIINDETGERKYSEGFEIASTPDQDREAEKAFKGELAKEYNVVGSNCAESVQSGLRAITWEDGSPTV
ncbi:unnamed protein product, partial [Chrysoparadoxa australica]